MALGTIFLRSGLELDLKVFSGKCRVGQHYMAMGHDETLLLKNALGAQTHSYCEVFCVSGNLLILTSGFLS